MTMRRSCEQPSREAPDRPVAVWLPPQYGASDQAKDRALWASIPDLSSGTPALRDVLLAVEWLRVELPFMLSLGFGRKILVDCQALSRKEWEAPTPSRCIAASSALGIARSPVDTSDGRPRGGTLALGRGTPDLHPAC